MPARSSDGRFPGAWLQGEKHDLATLAGAAVLVPLTWLLMGWRGTGLVSGHDGVSQSLPIFAALVEAGGDWSRLAYRADVLGGTRLADAWGPMPLLGLLAGLGLSATLVYDVFVFTLQAVWAFLALRAAGDLAHLWGAPPRPQPLHVVLAVWLGAFAPVVGWRVGWGHVNLVAGTLPFLGGLALLAAAAAGRASLTLSLTALAVFTNAPLYTGHQIELYGVVFGAPLLAGVWIAARAPLRRLAVPALLAAGAAALVLPAFWAMFDLARGSDSLRTLGGMGMARGGYRVAWLSSLLWMAPAEGALGVRPHELNAPLGPLLPLLLLAPWRRRPALMAGALASLALALVYVEDVRPFSDALLRLVPALDSFRIAPRLMLPLLAAGAVLALAGVLARDTEPLPRGAPLAGGAAALALFLLPPLPREVAAWLLAAALLLPRLRRAPAVLFAMAVAGASLGAFRERLLPFTDGEALLGAVRARGRTVQGLVPATTSPLERVALGADDPALIMNTAWAAGLSSLDGYLYPSRRFLALHCALQGQPFSPNLFFVRVAAGTEEARALFPLYNVRWCLTAAGADLSLGGCAESAGPAWFAQRRVVRWPSIDALAQGLRERAPELPALARDELWLQADDPAAGLALPPALDSRCAGARVLSVESRTGEPGARARVETPADCPLVFATNFVETLRAAAQDERGLARPAPVFVAYGALAAVWVPAGTREVQLAAVAPAIPGAAPLRLLGALLAAGALLLVVRAARG